MKVVTVSSTQARRQLFELIDLVAAGKTQVVIKKRNRPQVHLVVLPKNNMSEHNLTTLQGSLKPSKPYQPDETAQAHALYVQEQASKYK